MSAFAAELETLRRTEPLRVSGRVSALRGLTVLVDELAAPVGSLVSVGRRGVGGAADEEAVPGEVVGFSGGQAVVMTLGTTSGIRAGDEVVAEEPSPTARVGLGLLGRVVDALGRPIDGRAHPAGLEPRPLDPPPLGALARRRVTEPLRTGVRAIDLMTPMGRGQRLGIFAGPGVGKSTLMGQIARGTDADVSVIALIGERGREVKDFIEESLGEEGLARSVVVVATGDEPPLLRLRAARYACAAAEFFRDLGLSVLLMMDSATRFAHAQRQVGLSVGEPPATKGYTPSVFTQLALLLERAGAVEGDGRGGSITGLYTVLVEGDDMTEPVADAARGILDGHLVLSRKIAQRAHFPAIDVLDSVSRVQDAVSDAEHAQARRAVVRLLARYREVEELVRIGAYARGSDPETDAAIELIEAAEGLLRQRTDERTEFAEARGRLVALAQQAGETVERLRAQRGAPAKGGR